MITVLLALGSALAYGASDFVGGYVSRRTPAWGVAFVVQTASALAMLAAVLLDPKAPTGHDLSWGITTLRRVEPAARPAAADASADLEGDEHDERGEGVGGVGGDSLTDRADDPDGISGDDDLLATGSLLDEPHDGEEPFDDEEAEPEFGAFALAGADR